MKANIHPRYVEATVTCACGNTWTTKSTRATIRTDLCSNCHPFYTGEQRIVDSAGQVDRFRRRMNLRQERTANRRSSQAAPVQTPAQQRATLAQAAAHLPETEPAAAADVPPVPDSATATAPLSEDVVAQLEPETTSQE